RAAPRHGRDRRRDRVQRTAHADRAGTTERREAASAAANLGGGVPVGATPRPVAVHRRRAALARPTRPGRGRRPGSVAVAGGTSATGAAPPVAGSSPVSRSQRPARPRLRPRARTWPRSPSGSAPPSPGQSSPSNRQTLTGGGAVAVLVLLAGPAGTGCVPRRGRPDHLTRCLLPAPARGPRPGTGATAAGRTPPGRTPARGAATGSGRPHPVPDRRTRPDLRDATEAERWRGGAILLPLHPDRAGAGGA